MQLSFVRLRRGEADLLDLSYRAGRWGRWLHSAAAGYRSLLRARLRLRGFRLFAKYVGVVGCGYIRRLAR